jgi:hypothetical protein
MLKANSFPLLFRLLIGGDARAQRKETLTSLDA